MKLCHGLAIGLILISSLCSRGWAAESDAAASRQDSLWRLAEQAQVEEEQHLTLLPSLPLHDYLDGVVARLWAQTQSNLPLMTVRVIQDPKLKAYTYPNGVCYLSSGMLSRIENEDQLAMILAHEMVHYVRRHTLKADVRFAMSFAHGDNGPAAQKQVDGAGRPISLGQFVEAAERQADREGLALMRRAGYCPDQVLSLLANFEASTRRPAGRPAVGRRMAQFRTLLENQSAHDRCPEFVGTQQAYRLHIAPALIADARAALQRGQWEQALNSVSQYLVVQPQNAQAHFILGQIQSHRSIPDALPRAMAAYQEAIDLDRNYGAPYGALGVIHFKAGRKSMARHYFETYLALAPQASEKAYIREYLELCHE